MKRIISCIIILAVIASGAVTFAADNATADYEVEKSFLAAMGLMQTGEFTEAIVTKAEFIEYISRIVFFGLSRPTASQQPFTDVSRRHPLGGEIEYFRFNGVISGDGSGMFYPDDEITVTEGLCILLNLAGYREYALQNGGYPIGYMNAMTYSGMGRMNAVTDEKVTRSIAAKLLFDALKVKALDATVIISSGANHSRYRQTETLAEKYLDLYNEKGIMTANEYTALSGANKTAAGKAVIDGVLYASKPEFRDYLGFNLDFFYRMEEGSGERELISAIPYRNEVVSFSKYDLNGYANGTYRYSEEGRSGEMNANLAPVYDLLYNGVAVRRDLSNYFVPDDGTVTLIDNDDDGLYDVILVADYITSVIESVSAADNVVYLNKQASVQLERGAYRIFINGAETTDLTAIAVGSVVSLQRGYGDELFTLTLSSDEVSGTVAEKFSDGDINMIIVNGTEYKIVANGPSVALGTYYTLQLDFLGRVAHVKSANYEDSKWKVGFVMAAAVRNDMQKGFDVRLLMQDGSRSEYSIKTRVLLDGVRVEADSAAIRSILFDGADARRIMIRFTSSDDAITAIDTASPKVNDVIAEDSDSFTLLGEGTSYVYKTFSRVFEGKIPIGVSTKVFIVPNDATAAEAELEDYYVTDSSFFWNDGSYTVEAYKNEAKGLIADYLVCYQDAKPTSTKPENSLFVVEKVIDAMRSDGTLSKKLYGYYSGVKADYHFVTGYQVPAGIDVGDIARVSINNRGEIDLITVIYDASERQLLLANNPYYVDQANPRFYQSLRIVNGFVYDKEGSYLVVTPEMPPSGDYDDVKSTIEIHDASKYNIYVYDEHGGKPTVRTGTSGEVLTYLSVGGACTPVLIRTKFGGENGDMIIFNFQ